MKKHVWSVLLAVCLVFTLVPAARAAERSFDDVSANAWCADEIRWAAENDLMDGVGGASFAPDASTSRAMIWTILARLSGADVEGGTPWYAKAREWVMANGISDGTNPDGIISRQELVTMLYRYVGSPTVSDGSLAAMSAYSDSSSVGSWAQQAMAWGVSNGLISGIDGSLQPQGSATRAQTAVVLCRMDEKEIVNVSGKEPEQKPEEKPGQKPSSGGEVYVPVHYHSWDAGTVTTPATCAAEGVKTYTCLCGASTTEPIAVDASAHAWGGWTTDNGGHSRVCANDVSHIESGSCSGSTCVCGASYVAQVDDKCYETLEAAIAAADSSDVKLLDDIDLPTAVVVTKNVTLNLNGKTLTVSEDTVGDGVFHVTAGTLTINGDGVVNGLGKNDYSMAIWADGGNVVINGGSYTNVGAGEDDHYDLIYAKGGTITINGGTFECETPKWTLNCKDNNGTIIVTGGTFIGYDPSASSSENPIANFLAPGYTVIQTNGNWTVLEGVSTLDELQEAVQESGTVKLQADITVTDVDDRIFMTNNGTLDGNNKTVTYTGERNASGGSVGVLNTTGGTIKNLTVDGGENGRAIFMTSLTADLTVSDCVLDGAYSFNASVGGTAEYSLYFTGTEFKSWTSYGTGVKSASFTDCIFATYLRPYCDTTLTDCKFAEGFILNATTDVENITLTDCYVGDTLVTEANVTGLFEKDDSYTGTVVKVVNTVNTVA